jgi:hypothetical protein
MDSDSLAGSPQLHEYVMASQIPSDPFRLQPDAGAAARRAFEDEAPADLRQPSRHVLQAIALRAGLVD